MAGKVKPSSSKAKTSAPYQASPKKPTRSESPAPAVLSQATPALLSLTPQPVSVGPPSPDDDRMTKRARADEAVMAPSYHYVDHPTRKVIESKGLLPELGKDHFRIQYAKKCDAAAGWEGGIRCFSTFEHYSDLNAVLAGCHSWGKSCIRRASCVIIVNRSAQNKNTIVFCTNVKADSWTGDSTYMKNITFLTTPCDGHDALPQADIPAPLSTITYRVEGDVGIIAQKFPKDRFTETLRANGMTRIVRGTAALTVEQANEMREAGLLLIPMEAITSSVYEKQMALVIFPQSIGHRDIVTVLSRVCQSLDVWAAITSFRGRLLLKEGMSTDSVTTCLSSIGLSGKVLGVHPQVEKGWGRHRRSQDEGEDESAPQAHPDTDPASTLLVTSKHGAVPKQVAIQISIALSNLVPEQDSREIRVLNCNGKSALIRAPAAHVAKWSNSTVNKTYLLTSFAHVLAVRKQGEEERRVHMNGIGHGGDQLLTHVGAAAPVSMV